jgi:nucleoside-diphosphate-sugar epimerase
MIEISLPLMHILITGGAGFLGSHLTKRLLNEGHKVTVVDNFITGSKSNLPVDKDLTIVDKDVSDISYHTLQGLRQIDQIYHLASPASPNHHSPISYHALPMETMMVNTVGTHRMLEMAEWQGAKFLFASTSECYGDPEVTPQPESYNGNVSTTGPRSVYDEAKRFGETLTAHYWRKQGVDARIVRIFNTYGPQMATADMRMINNFIHQALRGDPLTLFGDGSQTRSLTYVDDTIEGMIRLMNYEKTKGEVVNIGSSEEHTVREYAELVKEITGSQSEIVCAEDLPDHDPKMRRADISKAKRLLNWEPKVPLRDGLKKMVEWVRSTL